MIRVMHPMRDYARCPRLCRSALLGAAAAILLAGCPSNTGDPPDDGTLPGPDAATPPADSMVDGSLPADAQVAPDGGGGGGCGKPAGANDRAWTVEHDGRVRTFYVHMPPGYDPDTPTPVVVNLHGRNTNAQSQILVSDLVSLADAQGFVAVHPEGVGMTWNAGLCCGEAMDNNVDDVGFISVLLDQLESDLCIDTHRVYATGLSNGGFMAQRLGCDLADRIAAFGSVAGPNGTVTCSPSRAVPMFHFHGTADTIVPYDGFMGQLSVADTLDGWVTRNACAAQSAVFFDQAEVRCEEWTGCGDNATARLCTITGGGHQWPGGFTIPGLGYNTNVISATQMMWAFFEAHPMP